MWMCLFVIIVLLVLCFLQGYVVPRLRQLQDMKCLGGEVGGYVLGVQCVVKGAVSISVQVLHIIESFGPAVLAAVLASVRCCAQ